MARRVRLILLLSFAVAAPIALARVLSYAPYTNRIAVPSFHARTSRWFALNELAPGEPMHYGQGQVVLYDARGEHEPRVIYPGPAQTAIITTVAVLDREPAPYILIAAFERPSASKHVWLLSTNGGESWIPIRELEGFQTNYRNIFEVDFGGPYSGGLNAPVSVGGVFPFVVSTSIGVYGVNASGQAKRLVAPTPWEPLLGRNRLGNRFLVRTAQGEVSIVDGDGNINPLGTIEPALSYCGWITDSGAAYVLSNHGSTRFLHLYRAGKKELIDMSTSGSGAPVSADSLSFFAVPTHDYNGAWMIHRTVGKPTTLSRHTVTTGKETFWSDVSGPQIEALHTASTPDKLLIQVHRPRVTAERWFVDPALAVWRVGEPAPRAYDELFLNEGWTKGFVHLDVDTYASGAPFVFDSGTVNAGPIPILSPGPGGGGSDVMQEWGVVRGSSRQRLVLPGMARQAGAFDSYWLSDVVVHNPLDASQEVTFRFVPIGENAQAASVKTTTLTLAKREIRVIEDVLHALFGLEFGGGALYIEPAEAVTATSRTYSRAKDGGAFGFSMPAIDFHNAIGARFAVSFAGAFPGPEYRTNMLLTDTSGRGTETRLVAHGVSGRMGVDNVAFSAPTNGVLQMNGLAGQLGLQSHESGALTIQPTRGTAIATVVSMDNRTNDPTYFPPDLPAPDVRTIPVIGHVSGAHNSKFRSDVFIVNTSDKARTVRLEAKRWDSNEAAKQLSFTLLPHEARVIRDALPTLFNMTGVARLRFGPIDGLGDGVRVTSRTYNLAEDGATYGCLIPPLNSFQSAAGGEKLEILGIVGGTDFRTNLGLVDLTNTFNGQNAEARITIVDDKGVMLDQFPIAIPTAGGTQINDLFGSRGIAQPRAAMVYVEVFNGLVGAYATLTDNTTNDSTYLGANLSSQP